MAADQLPPELASFVRAEVASGRFPSENAVLAEGIRLLRERERKLAALRRDVQTAVHELDAGQGIELTNETLPKFMDEILLEGRQRFNANQSQ